MYPLLTHNYSFCADEDEIFDSDFESTDEEMQQAEEMAGEKEVQEEEKRAVRVSYRRLLPSSLFQTSFRIHLTGLISDS